MASDLTPEELKIAEENLLQAAFESIGTRKRRQDASSIADLPVVECESLEGSSGKKKKKKERTTKKDQEFIAKVAVCEEVRSYPQLYQISHKQYHDKEVKDAVWKLVSEGVTNRIGSPVTVTECKKFWTALKESTRIYVDKNKVAKIREKSGAPSDLLDLYQSDGSQKFDVYESRWPFADHMAFFLPACARTAFTVSIGNSNSETNLKDPTNQSDGTFVYEEVEFLNTEDGSQSAAQPSSTATSFFTPVKGRSNKSQRDVVYDETLISVASSLNKLVDSHSVADKGL
ncbi:uncharacterized protein LOC129572380, partial [Sitodiplosis mosellana]|uniref:uncharacterized protein LOC129572380 n=1 Tax=Sitodiplosis mosellana TaxID=263140 RepID=UPI0024442920